MSIPKLPIEVLVLATMSAGKSTLLNALIGQELLPSANAATTAKVFAIEHVDQAKFEVFAETNGFTSYIDASIDILRDLNRSSPKNLIKLRGCLPLACSINSSLIIYDTPGPNNSIDNKHADIMFDALNNGDHNIILYLMNVTQLGINDDFHLLEDIKNNLNHEDNQHKKIVFILNKADELDAERGEDINEVVASTVNYLVDIGFDKPIVLPMSAKTALLAQKVLANRKLTRIEQMSFNFLLEDTEQPASNFFIASTLSSEEKNTIHEDWLESFNNKSSFFKKLFSKKSEKEGCTKQDLLILNSGLYALEWLLKRELEKIHPVNVYIKLFGNKKALRIDNSLLSGKHDLSLLINKENPSFAVREIIDFISSRKNPVNLFVFTEDESEFNKIRKQAFKKSNSYKLKLKTLRVDPRKHRFNEGLPLLEHIKYFI